MHGGVNVRLGDSTSVDGTLFAGLDSIDDVGGAQALKSNAVLVLER